MPVIHNIYCDESCHMEYDHQRFMVLGGLAVPNDLKIEVFDRIKTIRKQHGITKSEMKWTKVSSAAIDAYIALVNYFFDKDDLYFRGVVIDKKQLNHNSFGQSHDRFYYKMYFYLLNWFIAPDKQCNIYLDIKDAQGAEKIKKLHEVLCNSNYDFSRAMIRKIQEIHSHEVVLMQIADILIGAISYANRFPDYSGKSEAKNKLVKLICERSHSSLVRSTPQGARKFNIFCWKGQEK